MPTTYERRSRSIGSRTGRDQSPSRSSRASMSRHVPVALRRRTMRLQWPSALLAQLVEHLHGKEGVDGSSPSEGSRKGQQMAFFVASRGAVDSKNLSRRPIPSRERSGLDRRPDERG